MHIRGCRRCIRRSKTGRRGDDYLMSTPASETNDRSLFFPRSLFHVFLPLELNSCGQSSRRRHRLNQTWSLSYHSAHCRITRHPRDSFFCVDFHSSCWNEPSKTSQTRKHPTYVYVLHRERTASDSWCEPYPHCWNDNLELTSLRIIWVLCTYSRSGNRTHTQTPKETTMVSLFLLVWRTRHTLMLFSFVLPFSIALSLGRSKTHTTTTCMTWF